MGRQIAAPKALVARRVEDLHRWKGEGLASLAEYLAAKVDLALQHWFAHPLIP